MMKTDERRILIADRSEPMQGWLAVAAGKAFAAADGASADAVCVANGAELLFCLAEKGPFAVVVTHAGLPYISGAQVLAMVRTAGLNTPFVILDYLPTRAMRSFVAKAGNAHLIDDPLDATAVCHAVRALVANAPDGRRQHRRRPSAAGNAPVHGASLQPWTRE